MRREAAAPRVRNERVSLPNLSVKQIAAVEVSKAAAAAEVGFLGFSDGKCDSMTDRKPAGTCLHKTGTFDLEDAIGERSPGFRLACFCGLLHQRVSESFRYWREVSGLSSCMFLRFASSKSL